MHGLMGTWDWFWTVFTVVAWIVIVGGLAYVAVELLKEQHVHLGHFPHHRHP